MTILGDLADDLPAELASSNHRTLVIKGFGEVNVATLGERVAMEMA